METLSKTLSRKSASLGKDDLRMRKKDIIPLSLADTDLLRRWLRGESLANRHLNQLYCALMVGEMQFRERHKTDDGEMCPQHHITFAGVCAIMHSISSVMWARGMEIPVNIPVEEV